MELERNMLQLVPFTDPQSFIRFAPETGLHKGENRNILLDDSLDNSQHFVFKLWPRGRWYLKADKLLP